MPKAKSRKPKLTPAQIAAAQQEAARKAALAARPFLDAQGAAGGAQIVGQNVAGALGRAGQAVGQEVGRDVDAAKRLVRGGAEVLNLDKLGR